MKLLIVTQKIDVDDSNLGFFHRWVEEFAKHFDKVIVVCLEKGKHHLPDRVRVLSLGKESGRSRIKYIYRFYKYIWQERKNYDAVFVHMNKEYAILGWPLWRWRRKTIALWYVHKHVDWRLKKAEKLVDKIFTASGKSFRLPSKKVEVVGHGVDLEKFKPPPFRPPRGIFTILTAGRIAPVKNIDVLIEAAAFLKKRNFNFEIKIAGAQVLETDAAYFDGLKRSVKAESLEDRVFFVGAVPYNDIPNFYHSGDLFVNLSGTGSLDKAVLEAMASGLSILTSNEAFKDILPKENMTGLDAGEIAEKISVISRKTAMPDWFSMLEKNHNLENLAERVASFFNEMAFKYVRH